MKWSDYPAVFAVARNFSLNGIDIVSYDFSCPEYEPNATISMDAADLTLTAQTITRDPRGPKTPVTWTSNIIQMSVKAYYSLVNNVFVLQDLDVKHQFEFPYRMCRSDICEHCREWIRTLMHNQPKKEVVKKVLLQK